ncbi:hypothetical protein NDU88_001759, partial [Pleurodeles waltl]
MRCCSVVVVFRPQHRGGSSPLGSSPPLLRMRGQCGAPAPGEPRQQRAGPGTPLCGVLLGTYGAAP